MKQLLTLLLALVATVALRAQTSQIATLSHEGTVATYYGTNALVEAYNAAADGDVITLSSGTFTAPSSIDKDLTINGAGMIAENNGTILYGHYYINKSINMEGICSTAQVVIKPSQEANYNLVKCYFIDISTIGTSYEAQGQFINCISLKTDTDDYSYTFTNSVVKDVRTSSSHPQQFRNSYIEPHYEPSAYRHEISGAIFDNCIIQDNTSNYMSNSSTATNTYYIGSNTSFFSYMPLSGSTNHVINEEITLFKEGTLYELVDELAATWLGSDGTQVGIYGGDMPFDPIPNTPQILKLNVAKKTTADGKLPIEIEVKVD